LLAPRVDRNPVFDIPIAKLIMSHDRESAPFNFIVRVFQIPVPNVKRPMPERRAIIKQVYARRETDGFRKVV
jgi:hypothetical protein